MYMSAKYPSNLYITGWYIAFTNTLYGLIMLVDQYMVPVFLFLVFALTYPSVKLRQHLLNSLTYMGLHKPIFALAQDEGL